MLTALFDKGFIHTINADEAAVFDMHFRTNLTPIFFIVVLADLEKSNLDELKRLEMVRSLSSKTPWMHSYPNMPHTAVVQCELTGERIEMGGRPVITAGRRRSGPDGIVTVHDVSPEMKALNRWKEGRFEMDEYATAQEWREALRDAPKNFAAAMVAPAKSANQTLESLKVAAERMIDKDGSRLTTVRAALQVSGLPAQKYVEVIARWKRAGGPKLIDFAPYARHVLIVDLFRMLAMAHGLISSSKQSNFADIAYLYYVPFCEIFISWDKLHQRCAPLFLQPHQKFVWGPELRPELSSLAASYRDDPDLERFGLFGLSQKKTFALDSYFGSLFTSTIPHSQKRSKNLAPTLSPEANSALAERLIAMANAPPQSGDAGIESADLDKARIYKRAVPSRRGRFPIFGKDV